MIHLFLVTDTAAFHDTRHGGGTEEPPPSPHACPSADGDLHETARCDAVRFHDLRTAPLVGLAVNIVDRLIDVVAIHQRHVLLRGRDDFVVLAKFLEESSPEDSLWKDHGRPSSWSGPHLSGRPVSQTRRSASRSPRAGAIAEKSNVQTAGPLSLELGPLYNNVLESIRSVSIRKNEEVVS